MIKNYICTADVMMMEAGSGLSIFFSALVIYPASVAILENYYG